MIISLCANVLYEKIKMALYLNKGTSVHFSSVAQSCPTLCDPMDCSMPGFPVHHQLLELAQTHVHPVGGAIQPSHPLSSSSPAFNLSQHQGLFQWVSSSHQVARVLELHFQHQSFQWIFRTGFLYDWLVGPPCSPRDSQESSPTPQFKGINSSVLSFLYTPTFTSISHIQLSHLISQLNKIVLREPKNSHKRPFRAGLNHLYRGHPLNGTSAAQRREPQSWESDL